MPEQTTHAKSGNGVTFTWKVEGMDCASCVGKIQTALAKVPGITDVRASVMTETLTATLDQTRTSFEEIEKRVAGLGYTLTRKLPTSSDRDARSEEPGHPHENAWLDSHAHGPASGTRAAGPPAHKHDHAQGRAVANPGGGPPRAALSSSPVHCSPWPGSSSSPSRPQPPGCSS